MTRISFLKWLMPILIVTTLAFTEEEKADSSKEKDGFTWNTSGCVLLQTMQARHYKWFGGENRPQFFNNTLVNLTVNTYHNRHFSIHAGIEAFFGFNTHPYTQLAPFQPGLIESPVYPTQAELMYTFDEDNFFGVPEEFFKGAIRVGLFPYKYNPEVRNLGEYLFRSGTYPGWLKTNFDFATARLTGLCISTDLFKNWHNDILVTTEMEMYPFYDLSGSWISNYSFGRFASIGAGVCLAHFAPMNRDITTPKKDQNNNPINFYLKNIVMDTITNTVDTADTAGYYTFQGTKLMVRLMFDFKGLLPEGATRIFGKEDGKIYGELNILGVENQGWYYDDISERMPLTFGFNVPTFKLLDVLACEFEYYTTPYPNSYGNQVLFMKTKVGGTPIPYFGEENEVSSGLNFTPIQGTPYGTAGEKWDTYTKDSWKWSIYAKRSIGKHFAFVTQFARDHWRVSSNSQTRRDYEEALTNSNQWYWTVRLISTW